MQDGAVPRPPVPLDLLLASTSDLISVHAADGVVLWANAATEALLGVPPSRFVGTDPVRLVHPDDRQQLVEPLLRLRDQHETTRTFSVRVRHADGGYRVVESLARNHLDDPLLRCVVVTTRDVTDRTVAEDALRSSEARHRQLVECAPVGLCVVDEDTRLRFVNPTALDLSGHDAVEDVLGQPIAAFVLPEERERCVAGLRAALDDRVTPPPSEYHVVRPDGAPLVVLSSPLPYSWEDQPGALVVLQDVTQLRAAEERGAQESARIARILEASAEGVVGLDLAGRVTFMNPAAGEVLGLRPEKALGQDAHALWHHTRRDGTPYPVESCPCIAAAQQGPPASVDGEVFWRPDGTPVPVAYRIIPLHTDEPSGAVLTFHDVSERDAARERLAAGAEFLRGVLDSLPSLTAVLDRTGRIVEVNRAWNVFMVEHGGDPASCGVGVNVLEVCDGVVGPARASSAVVAAGLRAVLARTSRQHQSDVWDHGDPEGTYHSLSIVPLHAPEGGAVMTYTDITERKQLEVQAAHNATHDVLTGLPNRLLLLDRLAHALSARGGPHVGVLFLDLDGFKLVNDGYGHEAGDDLLRQLAARLTTHVRPEDTVARLAGDEFVVLCTSLQGREEAEHLAERLLQTVAEPFAVGPAEIVLGVSIGIALADAELCDPSGLLQGADQAMFDAKARGRNRYRVYDRAVHGGEHVRLAQALVLRGLVDDGDLLVHHQPVVDLRDGHLDGTEALLRWRGDVDLPDTATAIALAEEIGLIGQIGRFVLREAMRQGVTILDQTDAVLPLAVNLAPQELEDQLVTNVERASEATGYPLTSLTLELTERSVMTDPARAVGVLRALRERGVRIALDDFGVGHSSLASLRDLPLDVLKIDAGFVRGLMGEGADSRIIRAIVEMGRALDLDIVAEGIEHREQRDRLLELGCERGQGWLFSPARSPEALRLLRR